MLMTGHRQRSMFDRYSIRSVKDVAQALERVKQMPQSSEVGR